MKGLFVIAVLAVLNYAHAEEKCSCATFLRSAEDKSRPDMTSRMYFAEDEHVASCDASEQNACNEACIKKIGLGTDNGNLGHVRPDGKTVGDLACSLLKRDVHNGEVAAFAKVCEGDWVFAKASTPQYICCHDEHSTSCE